jgi:hypothetical protein
MHVIESVYTGAEAEPPALPPRPEPKVQAPPPLPPRVEHEVKSAPNPSPVQPSHNGKPPGDYPGSKPVSDVPIDVGDPMEDEHAPLLSGRQEDDSGNGPSSMKKAELSLMNKAEKKLKDYTEKQKSKSKKSSGSTKKEGQIQKLNFDYIKEAYWHKAYRYLNGGIIIASLVQAAVYFGVSFSSSVSLYGVTQITIREEAKFRNEWKVGAIMVPLAFVIFAITRGILYIARKNLAIDKHQTLDDAHSATNDKRKYVAGKHIEQLVSNPRHYAMLTWLEHGLVTSIMTFGLLQGGKYNDLFGIVSFTSIIFLMSIIAWYCEMLTTKIGPYFNFHQPSDKMTRWVWWQPKLAAVLNMILWGAPLMITLLASHSTLYYFMSIVSIGVNVLYYFFIVVLVDHTYGLLFYFTKTCVFYFIATVQLSFIYTMAFD